MDTIPWYQSAIIRQSIVQLIVAGMSLFGVASNTIDIDGTVGAIFAGVAALVAVWTVITRLRKPTPPITEEAAERSVARLRKQGGSARLGYVLIMLGIALGVATPVISSMQGCTQTRSAYKAAENPAELAYVLAEQYSALVKTAADLAEKSTTPASAITAMQKADAAAKPVVLQLRPLRDAYLATKSASTEAELQAAANRAVLALADLVRAVNAARGVR